MDKAIALFVLYMILYYTAGPYVFPDDTYTPREIVVVEEVRKPKTVDERKAFLHQLNRAERYTKTQETAFAFERHYDNGVRVRYFRNGLYVVYSSPQRTAFGRSMRAAAAEGRIAEAPGYKGHYFVDDDGRSTISIRHAGGKTPRLTDQDKSTIRGLCGFPVEGAIENYRRWKKRNGIGS